MDDQKNERRFNSLQWRVTLKLAAGTVVVAIVLSIIIGSAFTSHVHQALETRALAISTLVADDLGRTTHANDKIAVENILSGLKTDSDFFYALVMKTDNSILAELGDAPAQYSKKVALEKEVSLDKKQKCIFVTIPISTKKAVTGSLHVGFSTKTANSKAAQIGWVSAGTCLVALILLITYLSASINKNVSGPITNMLKMLRDMEQGELTDATLQNKSEYDIEELTEMHSILRVTVKTFRSNAKSIKVTSETVAKIAEEVLESASRLSKSAAKQVSSLGEAGTTTKEVEISGQATRNSAKSILKAAEKSVEISRDGLAVVSDSISQFRSVSDQVKTIVSAVEALTEKLSEVDAIVASVANVAGLSQLLSVNASIEASKAEAAGLRFGVVAKEVKKLAVQSKSATDTVRATLSEIKNGIEHISEISEDGRTRTEQGVKSSENSGRIIERLAGVINNTADVARQISTSISEQVVGIEGLTGAVVDIEASSQSNLTAIQQIHSHGEELRFRAQEMEELASRFNI